ncbi:MAG: hypothetical protein HY901_30895 [Deltaproteobacteria bacterium]|nr:hypothetical protein [Deltaproteobacteria bacterium]
MPTNLDITEAVRAIIAEEVTALLAPYQELMDRLEALFGEGPTRRGPGRPQVREEAAPAPARARRRRGSKAKKLSRLVRQFSVGQSVSYRQGRGSFAATVTDIDFEGGELVLKRVSDGKEVVRPATKVEAGAAATSEPATKPARKGKGGRGARKGRQTKASKPQSTEAFSVGQNVTYKQGKGTFEAKVVAIDEKTGQVALERVMDGKKVKRPAAKVGAAA